MSSDESDNDHVPLRSAQKRKRLQGSCDACKKKKVKCDSAETPDKICTNCLTLGIQCTHEQPTKKRGRKSYVALLEQRVAELEQMVRELQRKLQQSDASTAFSPLPLSTHGDRDDSDESDLESVGLIQHVKQLKLTQMDTIYFGPCGNLHFAKMVFETHGLPPWKPRSFSWDVRPWEGSDIQRSRWYLFTFPDEDLLAELMDLFFANTNQYIALLHEPTFRRDVASGLQSYDRRFGEVLLLVCALGAGFSDDPRVFIDGQSMQSAGWYWFDQARTSTRSLFEPFNLYDVQRSCLSAEYILRTSAPEASWVEVSHALRMSVSMGYHRYRPGPPTVESELRKRAFWCAYLLDRHSSFYRGRPPCLRDEDFDLALPVECDEAYWETLPFSSTPAFTQPPNTPSQGPYLHLHIKLCHIMTIALRTMYSIGRSKQAAGGTADVWFVRLNSMLDLWFQSIPPHLQWRPDIPERFLVQSAILHVVYYHIRIQVHRPFINSSPSSLAVCIDAAQSCVRVLEARQARRQIGTYGLWVAAFASGIVLCLNLLKKQKRLEQMTSDDCEVQDLQRCLNVLRLSEKRHIVSGWYLDCLESAFPATSSTAPKSPVGEVSFVPPAIDSASLSLDYWVLPHEIEQAFGMLGSDATASVPFAALASDAENFAETTNHGDWGYVPNSTQPWRGTFGGH